MALTPDDRRRPTILLIGASRGLGHAMAAEFLKRGWNVVGTVRGAGTRTLLHELADAHGDRVEIENLDICQADQIAALRERLSGRVFDMLFVNAGITNRDPTQAIGEVSTDEFMRVMITNSLSPMRVIESLEGNVSGDGLIGVMSSGQGSIGNNETGQRELYRGSKAALNMLTVQLSHTLRETSITVNSVDPGAPADLAVDASGKRVRQGMADGARSVLMLALGERGPVTGGFYGGEGPLPW